MITDLMPVIELNGSPRERGRIHGEEVRQVIDGLLRAWYEDLGSFGLEGQSEFVNDPEEYLKEFLSESSYMKSIKRWAPDLLEEVRGIAEGAGQSFETMLAFQLLDEEAMQIQRVNH